MILQKLSTTEKITVYRAFCKAFLNYFFPLTLDAEDTIERWLALGVDMNLSYGAFDGEELVAFALHSRRGQELYNFATGVIPEYRGQNLGARIFEEITQPVTLEVLKANDYARRSFAKAGFSEARELVTFTGTFGRGAQKPRGLRYEIRPFRPETVLALPPRGLPSSEHDRYALSRDESQHEIHELYDGTHLLAYAIFTPTQGTVRESGARRIEHLDQLFESMRFPGETIVFGGVDTREQELCDYLKSRHLRVYAEQCELRRSTPRAPESGSGNL